MKPLRIAIIGSGISGLGAAYILHPHHEITVYEQNPYVGGHSRTMPVTTPEGIVHVDTGFIVFNHRNYPLLTSLFRHLKVPTHKSDMSFGATINQHWLEYSTQTLSNIFAQKRNLYRPAFLRMILDILRFNQSAARYIGADPSITLGQCLDEMKMGRWFRQYYLLAMGAAIWSTPIEQMLDFPACTFVRFFENHGLLNPKGQPQWYTVVGGSKEYIARLTSSFRERIRLNCGAVQVTRLAEGVEVLDSQGQRTLYDRVIFACHANQALTVLEGPTKAEQEILGALRYQPNLMVLHGDTSFMPKRKAAWASWVYHCDTPEDKKSEVSLSYWMNNLQPLATQKPIIVTLNPTRKPPLELTYDQYTFEHPVFDSAAIRAQQRIEEIQGKDRIWYCGAYQRYGFHEDGLLSAVKVTTSMGLPVPWK